MDRSIAMRALSAALALVHEDPAVGSVSHRKGWTTEIVSHGESRWIRVSKDGSGSATLTRYANPASRPAGYPDSIGFVPHEIVWAGEEAGVSAAVWIAPEDPADVAAHIVTESVGTGWELESSANLGFPSINTVSLRKSERRRAVSIIWSNVVLSEGQVAAT